MSRYLCRIGVISILASVLLVCAMASPARAQNGAGAWGYTHNQLILDDLAYIQWRLIDTYQSMGRKNPAWDAQAIDFMKQTARHIVYADEPFPVRPDDITPESTMQLAQAGADLVKQGCDDPQVTYCYGVILSELHRDAEAVIQLRNAVNAFKNGNYPPDSIVVAASRLKQSGGLLLAGEMDSLNDAIERNAVKMFSFRRPGKMDCYFARNILKLALTDDFALESQVFNDVQNPANADPWLVKTFCGEHEIQAAWQARGSGWANAVTDAGWMGMRVDLAKARALLISAWEMHPAIPGPCDDMITVAMGQGADGGDTARVWYDRALIAEADDTEAFQNMIYDLYPRWGGSYDQMAALGMNAALSRRFDTQAPLWLMYAIDDIQSDSSGASGYTYVEPAVYNAMKTVLIGYINSVGNGHAKDWYRSALALLEGRGGEFEQGRRVLDQLGDHMMGDMFPTIAPDPQLTVSEIYAFTGPQAIAVRQAAAEFKTGHLKDAAKDFGQLVKLAVPGDPGAYYLEENATNLQANADFNAGERVDLLPSGAMHLWNAYKGEWHVDGQNDLVGLCTGDGLTLLSKNDFGTRFEVWVTMEGQTPGKAVSYCGLAMDFQRDGFYNGVLFGINKKAVVSYNNGKALSKRTTAEQDNQIYVAYWDGQYTATFNGAAVKLKVQTDPPQGAGNPSKPAIRVLTPIVGTTVTITQIKLRKLTAKPAGLGP